MEHLDVRSIGELFVLDRGPVNLFESIPELVDIINRFNISFS